ncbi:MULTISPECIES: hypothetical protein [Methanothrix]|uniref:Uncharacterized protein n=2 Tax=Methanothrix soehngenii TaxID=2223 RepID=A0A7K4AIF8_METSH|nr:hypothetical protein [Methanothrix soehngenii]MDD3550684.1 hypothetical protein [Methanothrix soehngenii]MDY0412480.1 hypothetical protein [Methanothrix soehngenii]NLJ22695.1 hypothetical protein [Methanothrix soehngenii]HOE46798.1 hypothetical protein [Methanothrix soehngenii]HPL21915.1 hypothetical protein [Methanothrix soehngenii]
MAICLASANPDTTTTGQLNTFPSGPIPQEEWNRTYGGSSDDVGTYGQQTKDGGYIITGYTSSYGADAPFSWLIKVQHRGDLWLIKTDAEGQKEWDRTYGGLGKDLGFFVQQTKDEGYIIVGGKKSFWIIGSYDLWIIKTDAKGNVLWDRTFGGSGEDLGFSVQQTNDDGYIIAGYTSFTNGKKAWIIKIDSQGNKQLDMATGRADSEAASIGLTKDGGYIITGYTPSSGSGKEDVWLIKTNSKLHWDWLKTFGGPNRDLGLSVQETEDGGYIIAGLTESFGAGKGDVWLIKTDPKGDREWDRTFGGSNFDSGASVQQTRDGGYIVTGYNTTTIDNVGSYSRLFNSDNIGRVWLIKTDSEGIELWNETFGGTRNDWGNSVQETRDGGYIITGVTESYGAGKEDVWLIKVR